MSLFLSERLDLFVGPHGVRAVRRRRGLRGNREIVFDRACAPDAAMTVGSCMDALAQGLADAGRLRGAAFVTVSNHFVRYAVVPPVPGMRAADRGVVAAHHMRSVYGEAADRWQVVLGRASAGSHALAGAVDAELVPAITAALRRAGAAPAAVEPLLVAAYNAARRDMSEEGTWLAVVEHGRLCVAALRGDAWLAVRSRRIDASLDEALPVLLEQVRLGSAVPLPPGRVHLAARGERIDGLAIAAPWSVVPVAWAH